MPIDHFFTIGTPHAKQGTPCEDYAISFKDRGKFAGALSDGCGGAKANTDVGARAWCQVFSQLALESEDIEGPEFLLKLLTAVRDLTTYGVMGDYLATLLGVYADEGKVQLFMGGDGGFIIQYKSGKTLIMYSEWANNAPYYPAYEWMPESKEILAAGGNGIPVTVYYLENQGEGWEETKQSMSAESFARNRVTTIEADELADIRSITLFSDGLLSFGVPITELANEFTAFKNFEGNFLKRRALRTLEQLAKAGRVQGDDLALLSYIPGD